MILKRVPGRLDDRQHLHNFCRLAAERTVRDQANIDNRQLPAAKTGLLLPAPESGRSEP